MRTGERSYKERQTKGVWVELIRSSLKLGHLIWNAPFLAGQFLVFSVRVDLFEVATTCVNSFDKEKS